MQPEPEVLEDVPPASTRVTFSDKREPASSSAAEAAQDPRPAPLLATNTTAATWAASDAGGGDALLGMLSPTEKEGEQLQPKGPKLSPADGDEWAQWGGSRQDPDALQALMQSTLTGPDAGLTQSTLLVKSDSTSSGPTSPQEPAQHVRFHKSPAFKDIMARLQAAVQGADDEDPLWEAIARHQAKASDRHWVADEKRLQCEECGDAFDGGITTSSKHHCRHCGEIYCDTCAPTRDPLPCELPPDTVVRVDDPGYVAMGAGMFGMFGAGSEASQYRRCVSCECLCAALTGAQSAEALRKWQAVESTQQLLNHRHILYRLPYHPISPDVKARLRDLFLGRTPAPATPDDAAEAEDSADASLTRGGSTEAKEYVFTGHSGWLMQLLMHGVDWTEPIEADKAVSFIDGSISTSKRERSCAHCCCTKDCKEQLRPEDIAVLFENLPAAAAAAAAPLVALLGGCQEAELRCLLTTLVANLSNPFWVGTAALGGLHISRSPLAQMLLKRAAESVAIHTQLFWALELAKQTATTEAHLQRSDSLMDTKGAAEGMSSVLTGAAFFGAGPVIGAAGTAFGMFAGGVGVAQAAGVRTAAEIWEAGGQANAVAAASGYQELQQLLLCSPATSAVATQVSRGQMLQMSLLLADAGAGAEEGAGPLEAAENEALRKRLQLANDAVFSGTDARGRPVVIAHHARLGVPLPVMPEWHCCGIDAHGAKRLRSATRPFMVDLHCVRSPTQRQLQDRRPLFPAGPEPEPEPEPESETERKVRVLVKKGDDLRQDQTVVEAIAMMSYILKRDLLETNRGGSRIKAGHIHFDYTDPNTNVTSKEVEDVRDLADSILTYRVLPTAPQAGLMEWVEDSTTLLAVKNQHLKDTAIDTRISGSSIAHHLAKGKTQAEHDKAQGQFTRSLAAYTVFTHLLGVSDRHLENIMLHDSGCLLHIDFGFICGAKPSHEKLLPDEAVRLCEDMITGMGGTGQ